MHTFRRTKIVCTIGPASRSEEALLALVRGGMDVARLNLSHGTHREHTAVFTRIRNVADREGRPIAVLFDTKGPAIRTGERTTPLLIKNGQEILFVPEGRNAADVTQNVITVNYDGFARDVGETDRILIENGEMVFDIVSVEPNGSVRAKSRQDGEIGSRRHVNLPGADVDLPTFSDKDREDIAFAEELRADFIALSFIRTGEDLEEARHLAPTPHLIAKIETVQAVKNISDIIRSADGIMVARGDLGVEIPFEEVFAVQNEIVARCRDAGKPVIVATQMLESMTLHPMPTRAEVTDVAHAVETGADAVMLSGETATGKHPALVLEAMDRIIRSTERSLEREHASPGAIHDDAEARAEAAVSLAASAHADALVVFTHRGNTARNIAKFRPHVPIVTLTSTREVQRKCALLYGVIPFIIPFGAPEQTIQEGLTKAREAAVIAPGQTVVLIADAAAKDAPVSSVQVREV